MLRTVATLALLFSLGAAPALAEEVSVSLRGSHASMVRQNQIARQNDYTFLRTPAQVRRFVEEGYLVPVEGNADYAVDDGVSFPVARPELRTFIERLGAQHRAACGEKLVVTSLTRPLSSQPWNSHSLSVHPAGMAVDLRVHTTPACREWLENTLLWLEERELLDVTREHNPPHFHVAVFPDVYRAHAARLAAAEESARAAAAAAKAAAERAPSPVTQASLAPAPPAEGSEESTGWPSLVAVGLALLALGVRRRCS